MPVPRLAPVIVSVAGALTVNSVGAVPPARAVVMVLVVGTFGAFKVTDTGDPATPPMQLRLTTVAEDGMVAVRKLVL
jgi:hypothetical protein